VKVNDHPVICNPHGELQGRWPVPAQDATEKQKAQQVFTMTQQSVQLGILAVQIELPRSLRTLIMEDSTQTYIKQLASSIHETYREILIPNWAGKKFYSKELARQVEEIVDVDIG